MQQQKQNIKLPNLKMAEEPEQLSKEDTISGQQTYEIVQDN